MKIKPILFSATAAGLLTAMVFATPFAGAQNKGRPSQSPFERCATLEQQIDKFYQELDALEDEFRKIQLANLQNRKRLWTLAGRDRENEEKRVSQKENESQRRVIALQHEVTLKRNQIGKAQIEVGQIERGFFRRGNEGPNSQIQKLENEILKSYENLDRIAESIKADSLEVHQLRNRRANIRGKDRDNEFKRLEDQIHTHSQHLVDFRTSAAKTENQIGRISKILPKYSPSSTAFSAIGAANPTVPEIQPDTKPTAGCQARLSR